jgi:guanosine-3',5'-bis(diphosphate) 3'-pyrophosphohydrolase
MTATVGSDLALLLKAASFSADRHRGQLRKGVDASPYINHPLEVASILANVGRISDVTTFVAALLHDTIEDTSASPEELDTEFGPEVRQLVEEVSDDKSLPKAERKRLQIDHTPSLSVAAKQIKLGDKICNVRDVAENPPTDWPLQRRRDHLDWAELVVAGCRGANLALEQHFAELMSRGREALAGEAWRLDIDAEVDRFFDDSSLPADGQPVAVIISGGVCAGKTTIRKQKYSTGYVLIDASEIFLNLSRGEYMPFPEALQEPMNLIGGLVAWRALSGRRNIVTEIIGAEVEPVQQLIDALRSIGYSVQGAVITCDVEEALRRNESRGGDDISAYYAEPFQRAWIVEVCAELAGPGAS